VKKKKKTRKEEDCGGVNSRNRFDKCGVDGQGAKKEPSEGRKGAEEGRSVKMGSLQ